MRNTLNLLVGLTFLYACTNSHKEKVYYPSGELKAVIPYKNDTVNGTAYAYFKDGSLKGESNFKNGELDGGKKYYYPSGQLEAVIPYINGKRQGQAYYYFEDGSIRGETTFNDDFRQGVGQFYHTNGNLKQYVIYKNDTIMKSATYREDGSLEVIREYNEDGKQFKYTHYLDSGTIDPSYKFKAVLVIPKADTVIKGDMYEAEIRFGHMTQSDIYAFIGDTTYVEKLYSKSFLKRIDKESSLLQINTDTCSAGNHTLTGVVFETCDSCNGVGYERFFAFDFYVTPPAGESF